MTLSTVPWPRAGFFRIGCLGMIGLITACASGPPPAPSPAEIAGRSAHSILLVPLNVVVALPPELESSTQVVTRALRARLVSGGKTVEQLQYRSARELWNASMKEIIDSGQPRSFESAARVLVRRAREGASFDAMIIPSLFVQNSEWDWRSRMARWDGAKQRVELIGRLRGSRPCTIGRPVKAASILVQILDSAGETIHTRQSGLDLIEHIEVGPSKNPDEHGIFCARVDDDPPVADGEALREGIARGLVPFLPEDLAPTNPPDQSGETAEDDEVDG